MTFGGITGRSSRKEYWLTVTLIFVLAVFTGHFFPGNALVVDAASMVALAIWVLAWARRLHDFGRSALLILVPIALCFLVFVIAALLGGDAILAAFDNKIVSDENAAEAGASYLLLVAMAVALIQIV